MKMRFGFSFARLALCSISLAALALLATGCASDAEASRNPSVNPSNPLSGPATSGRGPASVGTVQGGGVSSPGSLPGGGR